MSCTKPPSKRLCSTSVRTPSGRERRPCLLFAILPAILLEEIFLRCSAGDLQGLRATSRKLRALIDSKGHMDLAIKRAGLPSCFNIIEKLGEWPNMLRTMLYLPLSLLYGPADQNDSDSYKLMLAGGLCTVCGKYCGGPPYSSNLRVRLCGESNCMSRISSNEYTRFEQSYPNPSYQQAEVACYAQVPYMNGLKNINHSAVHPGDPPSESNGCRYLKAEWEQFDMTIRLAFFSPEPVLPPWECPRELAARRHEALEPIHYALCAWRHQAEVEGREIQEENMKILRTYATNQQRTVEDVLADPLIQRVLAAHARDQAFAYTSTFTHLRDGKGPPKDEAEKVVATTTDEHPHGDDKLVTDQLSDSPESAGDGSPRQAPLEDEPSPSLSSCQAPPPARSLDPSRVNKPKSRKVRRHDTFGRWRTKF
ncbi:hypothetical protein FB107DRAFT_272981 [Schizophyllum commune]